MRMPRRKYLIGATALVALAAGVAEAASARLHTMKVNAPDGSVIHVAYTGDVAPKVDIVPADALMPADVPVMADPFARMEQISAMMDARMNEMMQRAAFMQQQARQMQQHAVETGQVTQVAPGVTLVSSRGSVPKGMHVTYYSSATDVNGCTRSVSYSSDGSGAAPKMTQAASDGCDAARSNTRTMPAKAEKPAAEHPAPGEKV